MPDVCPIGTEIQTLLVPRSKFPTEQKARAWILSHGFHAKKIDVGQSVMRFRQLSPSHFEPESFRTIPLGKSGVQAVIGCPKGLASMATKKRSKKSKKSGHKSGHKKPRRAHHERLNPTDMALKKRIKSVVGGGR
jgi:hypothetical protein